MNPYAEPEPTVVKINSAADILGVLPHRLGFQPTESLVVVCLHGPRRRDELVMRFDLPDIRHDAELCDEVVARLRQRGAEGALLVCYTETPARHGLAREPLFRAVRRTLRRADIELVEALLVQGGRWWSYVCRDESCCPADGTPVSAELTPAASLYAAESVAQGSVVLADRDDMVASIEPLPVDDEVVEAMNDEVLELLKRGGVETVRGMVLATVLRLLRRWERGDCDIEASAALFVAFGLHSKPTRDRVMTWLLDHDAHLLTALFTELARRTPDEDAAPVCTVLAWFSYATGGGALTAIAVERALRADPDYEMARLIDAGLSAMQPPSRIYEVAEHVRADLAAEEAALEATGAVDREEAS